MQQKHPKLYLFLFFLMLLQNKTKPSPTKQQEERVKLCFVKHQTKYKAPT